MTDLKLSNQPLDLPIKHVSPELGVRAKAWRYEQRGGILVVSELRDAEGRFLGTVQTLVRNNVIYGYLRRSGKGKLVPR